MQEWHQTETDCIDGREEKHCLRYAKKEITLFEHIRLFYSVLSCVR